MADLFAYVSVKVADDDIAIAISQAKKQAIDKLGSKTVELYDWSWTSKEVCTTWRLKVPDVPPPPPPP